VGLPGDTIDAARYLQASEPRLEIGCRRVSRTGKPRVADGASDRRTVDSVLEEDGLLALGWRWIGAGHVVGEADEVGGHPGDFGGGEVSPEDRHHLRLHGADRPGRLGSVRGHDVRFHLAELLGLDAGSPQLAGGQREESSDCHAARRRFHEASQIAATLMFCLRARLPI